MAQHTWPALKKQPKAAALAASARLASAQTICGPLPPSSMSVCLMPAREQMDSPVTVSPVKPMRATSGCATR